MGKHTSAGAALAQHGMSERASQRRQPSPPPPRSLPRTRKTRTGLHAGLDRAPAPLSALPAARRDGGRGPRGSPRSQRGPARVRAGGRGLRGAPNPRELLRARGRGGPRRAPRAAERRWAGRGAGLSPVLRGRGCRRRRCPARAGSAGGRRGAAMRSSCAGEDGSVKLWGAARCPPAPCSVLSSRIVFRGHGHVCSCDGEMRLVLDLPPPTPPSHPPLEDLYCMYRRL